MYGTSLIIFWEVLEAALIIGVAAAATHAVPERNRFLMAGIAGGGIASLLVTTLSREFAGVAGIGHGILNAVILGAVVLLLAWHGFWLQRSAHPAVANGARGKRMTRCAMLALSLTAALAILREASETGEVLYQVLAEGGHSVFAVLIASILSLATGIVAGLAFYGAILRLSARWFLSVTSGIVILISAATSSKLAAVLVHIEWLPAPGSAVLNPSWLDRDTAAGALLEAIAGHEVVFEPYQALFYIAAILVTTTAMRLGRRRA